MAMGYQVLSMNSPNLLMVKKALTTVSFEQSQALLKEVLEMNSADQIKQRVENVLRENGLSQIVRSRR
jgi:signal transduction protein with GAF and PtsI domain